MDDTEPQDYAIDLVDEVGEDIVDVLTEVYFLLTNQQKLELKKNIS